MPAIPEDDPELAQLLQEQEEFFRSKSKPAATIVKHAFKATGGGGGEGKEDQIPQPRATDTESEKVAPPVLLGGIVEKREGTKAVCQPIRITSGPSMGFPKAEFRKRPLKSSKAATSTPQADPLSAKVGEKTNGPPVASVPREPDVMRPPMPKAPRGPRVVDGMNLDDLHRENLRRVSAMGDDEVAMAQQEILTMLSPEAIEILRGKAGLDAVKPAGKGGKRDEEPEKREAERRAELLRRKIDSEEALDRATRELLTEEERGAVDWFNAPPLKSGEEGQGEELRFDLEGGVIERERAEEIPAHSGLYHNPEQRAGYTLQQLCDIAHSSHEAQRASAFRTWSLLLRRDDTLGRLKATNTQLPAELPIVLLAGLEDRHLGGRMNALAALEALLVDPHDQEQRDKAFDHAEGDVGWPPVCGPIKLVALKPLPKDGRDEEGEEKKEEDEKEASLEERPMTDSDKAMRDIVSDPAVGLLRYGLLTRLTRLLSDPTVPPGGLAGVWVILAWLAQRSVETAERIADRPGLLPPLERSALQGGWRELRLLRVLAQASRRVCLSLGLRGTLRGCKGVLGLGHVEARAKAEGLRLWRVALGYGADLEALLDVLPLLVRAEASRAKEEKAGEGGAGTARTTKVCEGVWVTWPPELLVGLYRALEAACGVVGERRRGKAGVGGNYAGVSLEASVVVECARRLSGIVAATLTALEEKGEAGVALLSARVHFVAAALECGGIVEGEGGGERAAQAAQVVMEAVEGHWDTAVKDAQHAKAALLQLRHLQPAASPTEAEGGVGSVDVLFGLSRLWAALLGPSVACPVALVNRRALCSLERLASALDLVDDWRTAAADALSSSTVLQSLSASACIPTQHLRRLLVYLEHSVLCLLTSTNPTAGQYADQARRLVPLCGPGCEHLCLDLLRLSNLSTYPALLSLYTNVILGPCPPPVLSPRRAPSLIPSLLLHASLTAPAPLLPLPFHYLLSPLISHSGSDLALTSTLLTETLQLLASTPSYTSLLPAPLLLYHLLALSLFPIDALPLSLLPLFLPLARRTLSSLPPSTLPTHLTQAAYTLQPPSALTHSPADSLQALANDLVEAFTEQSHGLELCAWGVRLFLRRALDSSLREAVWRDLCKASMLHLLDPAAFQPQDDTQAPVQETEEQEEDDALPFLYPPEDDSTLLDEYARVLSDRYYPSLTTDRGGWALLLATHHLGLDLEPVTRPLQDPSSTSSVSPPCGGLREAQRRRLRGLVDTATPEALELLFTQALRPPSPDAPLSFTAWKKGVEARAQQLRQGGGEGEGQVEWAPRVERLADVVLEVMGATQEARQVLEHKCPWLLAYGDSQ